MSAPQLTVYHQGRTVISGDRANTMLQTCDTVADLRSFTGVPGIDVQTRGQDVVGDANWGIFYWNQGATNPVDNGTTTIVPFNSVQGCWQKLLFPGSSATGPYDIAGQSAAGSTLSASQVVTRFTATRTILFPPNFGLILGGQSVSSAAAAATASAVFTINQAAAATPNTFLQIGTLTYPASGVVGVFASTGGLSQGMMVGDSLTVVAPASPDATLAGISFTLAGQWS